MSETIPESLDAPRTAEHPTSIAVLDVGAGEHPHRDATKTLDIREDIPVDYSGVDIGVDEWPLPDESVQHAVCNDVIEHVPPDRLGHVWRELDRVLVPGGMARIELPHAGSWAAATDMTHQGTGGTTPDVDRYFSDDPGALEAYWPDLDWDVRAYAHIQFPTVLRPSLRYHTLVDDGKRSMNWVKLPFTEAVVVINIRKKGGMAAVAEDIGIPEHIFRAAFEADENVRKCLARYHRGEERAAGDLAANIRLWQCGEPTHEVFD